MEKKNRKVAIMQPYVFPYIGYFQLIHAADIFVFYDDVNFIKKGWINRNQIILNQQAYKFTIPLVGASQNKLINEIPVLWESKFDQKLIQQLELGYKTAPYLSDVLGLVQEVFSDKSSNISELAQKSVRLTCQYLGLEKKFYVSSELGVSKDMGRADRLIEITKHFGTEQYINAINGRDLYSKVDFKQMGVDLAFVSPILNKYKQGNLIDFIPSLSILDVLMWNEKSEISEMLKSYEIT